MTGEPGKINGKKLPLDVQAFRRMIDENFLYVDKTAVISRLINSGGSYFFLSRPRRFGKSLLVSTMKEVFSGNKALFENLDIYNQIDWKPYPVIHFDFTLPGVDEHITVSEALAREVDKITRNRNLPVVEGNHKDKFRYLIENLSKKENKPVVILVDEYDQFIVRNITDDNRKSRHRDQLKEFFSVLKGSSEFLRFVFITGVSRFSRVSIFSDLNNLIDLTFDPKFSSIAGYTEDELSGYFGDYIDRFADQEKIERERLIGLIRKWYNGYSWDGHTRVYNPIAILKLFSNFRFGDYWYSSCTPTFLVELIRERKIKVHELDRVELSRSFLENMEVDRLELIPLLFQTGYLTVVERIKKSIDSESFVIDYPNKDVRTSFLTYLLADFSRDNLSLIDQIADAFRENRVNDALELMRGIFASVPYDHFDASKESSFHAVMHVVFKLVLDRVDAEPHSNLGRIDEVVETDRFVYVFEFKMNNPRQALDQIHKKKYYQPYINKGKTIILAAVAFSQNHRNIKNWIIEPYNI